MTCSIEPRLAGARAANGPPSSSLVPTEPQASEQVGPRSAGPQARLRWIVDTHIDFVARVLRNAGTPEPEIDDDVQRTFIIVARRLQDVRPGSEKSFLLKTALYVAAHARRTVARRREVPTEITAEIVDSAAGPEHLIDQKRARQLLDEVLATMDTPLRTVFVLYEFEDMSTVEIARVLEIPRGTVASRLRRARVLFQERVRALVTRVKSR